MKKNLNLDVNRKTGELMNMNDDGGLNILPGSTEELIIYSEKRRAMTESLQTFDLIVCFFL